MDDRNLAADEKRREIQLETMKAKVETDMNASIAQRAALASTAEARRLEQVAAGVRSSAIDGVVEKDRELGRARGLARVAQVTNYLFGILYGLLAIRLVLGLAAARSSAGFVHFIDALTNPFYGPFRGIVASRPIADGGYTLILPLLICMGAYGLLHLAILGVLRLFAHRQTSI